MFFSYLESRRHQPLPDGCTQEELQIKNFLQCRRPCVQFHCLYAFSSPERENGIYVQGVCLSKEQIFSRCFLNAQIIIRVLKYFLKMKKHCSSVLLRITENTNSAALSRLTVSSAWRTVGTSGVSSCSRQLWHNQDHLKHKALKY